MNAQNGSLKTGGTHAQNDSKGTGAAKPRARGMIQPLKVRNFNLLFGGQTISTFGDALYMVALPWLILTTGANNYHKSLDGTKVTTYAQWRSQADFEAMLQSPETAPQFQALSQLATSFEPHLYEVVFVDEAVAE